MCQHNSKTAQSVSTDFSHSVSTSVSTEVRQSDAFSGLQHPTGLFILTGFVPDAGSGNGMIRLFRLAGEQAGTGRDIRPVFWGGVRNIICFAPGKLCFQLREIDFVTENSLPARGGKTPPKSSFFTGHPVCQPEFQFFKMSSPSPPAICSTGARKRAETKTKTRGRRPLRRSEPATIPHKKKAVSTGDYCVKQRTGLRSNSSSQRTSSVLGRPSERRA